MIPDASHYDATPAVELLLAAAQGRIGTDQRLIRSLTSRPDETVAALVPFALHSVTDWRFDFTDDVLNLCRHFNDIRLMPIYLELLKEEPEDLPDEFCDVFAPLGAAAVEPLLSLYAELEEERGGETAFALASIGVKDPRILAILTERLEFDMEDTAITLSLYDDQAAIPALEKMLTAVGENRDLSLAIAELKEGPREPFIPPFDLFALYPETEMPAFDLLTAEELLELLDSADEALRIGAAKSLADEDLTAGEAATVFAHAKKEPSATVRALCWAALDGAIDSDEIKTELLARLDDITLTPEERGGALVGLAQLSDDHEIQNTMLEFYRDPATRHKAVEAMWRSLDPEFGEYFSKHLEDEDHALRRIALRGAGFQGMAWEAGRIRKSIAIPELREDALFAYAMSIPSEITAGRVRSLLARIDKDAGGLRPPELGVVQMALDERLRRAGKPPIFRDDDEISDLDED